MAREEVSKSVPEYLRLLKSYFKPGTILVHERQSSCFGSRWPLVVYGRVKSRRCQFKSGNDCDSPGRFTVEVDLEFITLSHGMTAFLPEITFGRGLLEYRTAEMTNPGQAIVDFWNELTMALCNTRDYPTAEPKFFSLFMDESMRNADMKSGSFNFRPITDRERKNLDRRQTRIKNILHPRKRNKRK